MRASEEEGIEITPYRGSFRTILTGLCQARLGPRLRLLKDLLLAVASRNSAYTVIVPIPVWVAALQEMAEVQKWDNFKNEVAQRMGRDGCGSVALIGLLHRQGNRTRSGGCS